MGLSITRVTKTEKHNLDSKVAEYAFYLQEAKKFEWLKGYEFKVIIDIGANEGQFAMKIGAVFPNSKIYCFEPLKKAFEQLKSTFSSNTRIVVHNLGLGEVNEERQIFRNEYSPSSSILEMLDLHKSNFDYAVNTTAEEISIRKLDGIFPGEIGKPLLIKIDVQGYEMHVLKGGESVINQADVIIIETSFYHLYKDQPLFEDIYDYLKCRGFRYAGNVEQLVSPADQKILQADAVFIKDKRAKNSSKDNHLI